MQNTRIVLASRPVGDPQLSDFRLEQVTAPSPGPGEVLLRVLYLSLDPYMRGRMNEGKSYAAPVQIGDVMDGRAVAEVIESRHPDFATGQIVLGRPGWQQFAVSNGTGLRKLDPRAAPLTAHLGVLGMPGLTAYAGLLTIGQPKPGETVVVAAATGPVGATVGQIAKIKGARAVGIAGGPAKRKELVDRFSFDVALDHRSPAFVDELRAACPKGIDVYFENVGGAVADAVWPLLNDFARIPVCGLVSQYNATSLPAGPDRTPDLLFRILRSRLTLRGFIVSDFADQEPQFQRDMATWIAQGRVRSLEDIVDGLAAAPEALIGLLRGRNFGKVIVRVGAEEHTT